MFNYKCYNNKLIIVLYITIIMIDIVITKIIY